MCSWGPSLLLLCLIVNGGSTVIAAKGTTYPPLVMTKNGQLRGQQLGVKGTQRVVNAFFGIPFAKPPLGELRFSPPEPAEPWNNVKEATTYPPMCTLTRFHAGPCGPPFSPSTILTGSGGKRKVQLSSLPSDSSEVQQFQKGGGLPVDVA